jgi:hypothetical protein
MKIFFRIYCFIAVSNGRARRKRVKVKENGKEERNDVKLEF